MNHRIMEGDEKFYLLSALEDAWLNTKHHVPVFKAPCSLSKEKFITHLPTSKLKVGYVSICPQNMKYHSEIKISAF